MTVNLLNSTRTITVWGYGYDMGTCEFDYINTHDEATGEELDEPEYEPSDEYEIDDSYVSFPPTLYFKNENNGEQIIIDSVEDFKKYGIQVDECLINPPEKKPKEEKEDEDKDYYLVWEQESKGTWGKITFAEGEVVDLSRLKIKWECDSYFDFSTCSVWYLNEEGEEEEICDNLCTEGKSVDTYLEWE